MKRHLEYVEFYITNVCNLNCNSCNRFNNYAFSGHMDWQQHADDYVKWSKILDVDRIGILGGEPMLHPNFDQWIHFVAELWPDANIMIMSNGTQLDRWPNLYQLFQQYRGRVRLDISRHNADQKEHTLKKIESLYPSTYTKFFINSDEIFSATGTHGYYVTSNNADDKSVIDPAVIGPEIWADKSYEVVYRDQYATIRYTTADSFDPAVVRLDTVNQKLFLDDQLSDPAAAVRHCSCKHSHHFLHGKLYKCGVTAVLPEFVKQFDVAATTEKNNLIRTYTPAEWHWDSHHLDQFINNLVDGNAIPQCSLCAENSAPKMFAAGTKKIKIEKLKTAS
jgi:organic radical activating enzyme